MCKIKYNTDMADERVDEYKFVNNLSAIDGIEVFQEKLKEFKVTTVNVLNEKGKEAIDKEIGTYITFEMDNIKYIEEKEIVVKKLKEELKKLIDTNESVLVIGLGNSSITADALGSKVINNIEVTRHILKLASNILASNTREVSAIAPGVMGKTGVETTEIIACVSNIVKPKYLIVIDSLMSKSIERVGSSIQLSNTGITPGSGITGYNKKIDSNLTDAKVISIGVPMVVDVATIANDIIEKIEENDEDNSTIRYNKIVKALDSENYIVTPKDIDDLIDIMSNIISQSINETINIDF